MEVLALISQARDIPQVVSWAAEFAKARSASLTVMCWAYAPLHQYRSDLANCDYLVTEVRSFLDAASRDGELFKLQAAGKVEVLGTLHRKAWMAAEHRARHSAEVEIIVAAAEDQAGKTGGSYASNPLLNHSPCNTVILFGGEQRSCKANRVLVGTDESPNDSAAFFLASRMAAVSNTTVTLARTEKDFEDESFEVGRRELRQLMRDAGVESDDNITCRVFKAGDRDTISAVMDDSDLVLLSVNSRHVHTVVQMTSQPTVAVIKRAPPLRPWRSKYSANWLPRLSPADYADLIEVLRRGSRLSADFLIMLCLAAVVASMGLLQDSAAVVIGSMLLAPLMTPMLGCGLALAQANPKLGNIALQAVVLGLCCTLLISLVLGLVTPGVELTPQILARGDPTSLDMVVALASAAAAAYALARPNLVGSIAGVAIATALLPPLCSVGVSIAYGDFANALGAALLFSTNFVAIVLGAATAFRLMGITPARVNVKQRRWVLRTAVALSLAAILFFVPLQQSLMRNAVLAKPQPRTIPLARAVMLSLEQAIDRHPDVELIIAGRPASRNDDTGAILVLGARRQVDCAYANTLTALLRREMKDRALKVKVNCLQELWPAAE